MPQLNHAADSPLRALAPYLPAPQLADMQERCRTYADGMEILVPAVSTSRAGSRIQAGSLADTKYGILRP